MFMNANKTNVSYSTPRWVWTLLTLLISSNSVMAEERQHENYFWDDVSTSKNIQIGLDTWKIEKTLGPASIFDNYQQLNLPDSQPSGEFQNPSPWIKVNAAARIDNKVLRLQYNRDNNLGNRIEELSIDSAYNSLGLRVGVLNLKISWCRTNDLESPWIRETDNFCVTRSTSGPTKSAPGIQTYANTLIGSFKVQAVAGVYRPMLLGMSTAQVVNKSSDSIKVIQDDKYGMSINAIDLDNGLDMRLGHLRNTLMTNIVNTTPTPSSRTNNNWNVWYAAISANISPSLSMRLSRFNSHEIFDTLYPPEQPTAGDMLDGIPSHVLRKRISNVWELNYQHTAKDVFSFAHSKYDVKDQNFSANLNIRPGTVIIYNQEDYMLNNTNTSASWRRDWQKGIFTILQITRTDLKQESRTYAYSHSIGRAVGLRLGYIF
jgi:hypothetical protein